MSLEQHDQHHRYSLLADQVDVVSSCVKMILILESIQNNDVYISKYNKNYYYFF